MNQVFKAEEFDVLSERLRIAKVVRKSEIVHQKLTVQPNEHWGITGGWDVDVLWVYLSNDKSMFTTLSLMLF